MKIAILGGDGFCGWPTALHLSAEGHDVAIVDNLSRRKIDVELGVESLTPIASQADRLLAWTEISGQTIRSYEFDVSKEFATLCQFLAEEQPEAIVHFAEQRAAPYSMKSARHKIYTVDNNVSATHNLLAAAIETGIDPHIVHLGTMGVYGYSGSELPIPEGYLPVQPVADDGTTLSTREILYPSSPGSVYHMTKVIDQHLFFYYAKNDGLRITDLHQGIVWGTQTEQTKRDDRLINRFDYDGDYGTVLNRFLMQSAVGHPISVHGTGGQTRAFINIRDSVRCVELALDDPPESGDRVRIRNQMTETHTVADLAKIISRLTGAEVEHVKNPRNEATENELAVSNRSFIDLGLEPTFLQEGLLEEAREVATRYVDRCDLRRIPAQSLWNSKVPAAADETLIQL